MKRILIWILIGTFWVACGFGSYGLTLGMFTHECPWQRSTSFAVSMAFTGPVSLIVILAMDGGAHWRTTPLTTEERWQAFHEESPSLSRAYFEREYN